MDEETIKFSLFALFWICLPFLLNELFDPFPPWRKKESQGHPHSQEPS